jgi:hypothetical protein
MFNIKRFHLYLSLLVPLVPVGSAIGQEESRRAYFLTGEYHFAVEELDLNEARSPIQTLLASADLSTVGSYQPFLLAQAEKEQGDEEKPLSPECAKFANDPHADLGDVLRAGCEPTLAQMSRLMDNPLGNVAMWINQVDWYKMENDDFSSESENKYTYMGILQFPKGISKNFNVINRIVYSVVSQPLDQGKVDRLFDGDIGEAPGSTLPPSHTDAAPINLINGREVGFGDMYYVGLLSPKEGIKHEGGGSSVWGVGLDLGFPTASKDVLGAGKWTAGPSALYAYLGPKWKLGALWQQYFSYAGDSDRSDVNLSNIQYFYYYSLTDTVSIGAGPNIIANWEQNSDNRWTVPIGLGVNTTVNFGKLPVRFALEGHYSVIRPDSIPAPTWDVRFMIIPAVPSALFKWMQ